MAGWETRRAWLWRMADNIPEGLDTPLAVAKYETAAFFADGRKVNFHLDRDLQEGYEISKTDAKSIAYIARGGNCVYIFSM